MIAILQLGGYFVLLWLLTIGGNSVCRLVLMASATKTPPEQGEQMSLRAGRMMACWSGSWCLSA